MRRIIRQGAIAVAACALFSTATYAATQASVTRTSKQLAAAAQTTRDAGGASLSRHVTSVHSQVADPQLASKHWAAGKLAKVAMLSRATGLSLDDAAAALATGTPFGKIVAQHGGSISGTQQALTAALRGMNANTLAARAGIEDTDEDGDSNAIDDDVDGDGIDNADDEDVDGDGIDNADDEDVDDDGIDNADDDDVDGDTVDNGEDEDIDGDGDDNALDDDDDGDGLADNEDNDEDGDGTDNGNEDDDSQA